MKRIMLVLTFVLAAAAAAFAHEGNDHVRGTVTAITPTSVTVQVGKTTKTLTLDDKTVYRKSGQPAHLADLKVGDRVVVDVPEKGTEAKMIQFGAAAPKKTASAK